MKSITSTLAGGLLLLSAQAARAAPAQEVAGNETDFGACVELVARHGNWHLRIACPMSVEILW